MKSMITAAAMLFSTAAAANDLSPANIAIPVQVNAVNATVTGDGWPVANVSVTATFGNECQVPTADELVMIPSYQDEYDTLSLALGNLATRGCTAEYAPVTVTINLGTFTRPNDGLFGKILVNGKKAD